MRKLNLLFINIVLIISSNHIPMKAQNTDYIHMIEYAIKAPSGHNTQPWLFKINNDNIEVLPNLQKALPVVDPDNRELFISLGCAIENLCIAASNKGYKAEPVIFTNGTTTINLKKDSLQEKNILFEQIPVRQTNRSVYNGIMITDSIIDIISNIESEENIQIYFYKRGTALYDTITDYVIAGNSIQMGDNAFKEELKSWMRFNKKHQDEYNDGLSYAVFGAPNLPRFIAKPIISNAVNAKSQNKGDLKKIKSSSHFILFTTKTNTIIEWINLGRSLERVLLKLTESGLVHSYLNQPNEIEELSVKMNESLNIKEEYTTILLRIGYGNKMPYSKRKSVESIIIND